MSANGRNSATMRIGNQSPDVAPVTYCVRYRYLTDRPGMTYTHRADSPEALEDFLRPIRHNIEIRAKWEETVDHSG